MPRVVRLNVVFINVFLFFTFVYFSEDHVKLWFISRGALRPQRMKLANYYFPSVGLFASAKHRKVPRSTNCVVAGRLFVALNHCKGNCNVVGRWAPTTFVDAFPRPWFWGVSDVPQSDPVRASWRCVWRGLEAMFLPKTFADFRPKLWPIFDQSFG